MTTVPNFVATGKEYNNHNEMIFTEGEFVGVSWIFGGMKFANEENEDGSIDMSFDYELTGDVKPKDEAKFGKLLGDVILKILEEQIAKGEAVYTGGTD